MTQAPPAPPPQPSWADAQRALRLLALDPVGLGGLWLRARSGPVRARFLEALDQVPLPRRRLHPSISDEQLFGGLDLARTLETGALAHTAGMLDEPACLVLTMAERAEAGLAARLSGALDGSGARSTGHCLIALDEGADEAETLSAALSERLAFHLDLTEVAYSSATYDLEVGEAGDPAQVGFDPEVLSQLTLLAAQLGIDSARATLFALRAARANAALLGRNRVEFADVETAARLVLAPRATTLPPPPDTDDNPREETPDTAQDAPSPDESQSATNIPQDMLLEAVRSALPADLLARLAIKKTRRASGSGGTGAKVRGNRRGRPLPPRPGKLGSGTRVDLVATLRAAAPWQPLRAGLSPRGQGLQIWPSDIRTKRYEQTSDRLLIFAVDASGSAAVARLAEAKGAVEILLGEAYARRDHVALVSFRGDCAETLLPPTRSLVQTKRRLAQLPGGGGTPLAAGLRSALAEAIAARGRGLTPTIALLTDGRANIALDGNADRKRAAADAISIAQAVLANGIDALVIDVSKRPERALATLAEAMDAAYIPLPRANASRLAESVGAALKTS